MGYRWGNTDCAKGWTLTRRTTLNLPIVRKQSWYCILQLEATKSTKVLATQRTITKFNKKETKRQGSYRIELEAIPGEVNFGTNLR